MNFGITIIGIIIIALIFLPFILISRSRIIKTKQIQRTLSDFALQHGCQVSQQELCSDFIIGIDEVKNYVFFIKRDDYRYHSNFVNLADFNNCKLINIGRSVGRDSSYKVIERLELCFVPKEKDGKEILFEFYNAEKRSQLNDELQCIEKWSKLINSSMKR